LNQERKGRSKSPYRGYPEDDYLKYMRYYAKPNRNMSRPKRMDYADEVDGTRNSSGWKVSTKRKRQWKVCKPSCRALNSTVDEFELLTDMYVEDEEDDYFEMEEIWATVDTQKSEKREVSAMTKANNNSYYVSEMMFLKEYGLSDDEVNKLGERIEEEEYQYNRFLIDFRDYKAKELFEFMEEVGFTNIHDLVLEFPEVMTWDIHMFQSTLMSAYPHVLDYDDLMKRLNANPRMLEWFEDDYGDGDIGVDFAGGRLNMVRAEIHEVNNTIDEANKTIAEAQKTIERSEEKLRNLNWQLKVMENKRIYQALIDRKKTYSEVMEFICPKGDPSDARLAEWFVLM